MGWGRCYWFWLGYSCWSKNQSVIQWLCSVIKFLPFLSELRTQETYGRVLYNDHDRFSNLNLLWTVGVVQLNYSGIYNRPSWSECYRWALFTLSECYRRPRMATLKELPEEWSILSDSCRPQIYGKYLFFFSIDRIGNLLTVSQGG